MFTFLESTSGIKYEPLMWFENPGVLNCWCQKKPLPCNFYASVVAEEMLSLLVYNWV